MAFWSGIDDKNHATKNDLEFMAVPPRSPRVILTDRADGKQWLLSWTTTPPAADGLGYITLTDVLPTSDNGNYRVYPPYDGPVVKWVSSPVAHSQGAEPLSYTNVRARLLVRGGYLGFEVIPFDVSTTRVMARKGVQRINREIIRPSNYDASGPFNVLAWRDMEF